MGRRSVERKASVQKRPRRRRRPLKRARQLELVTAYRGRGGPRPGSGRKPGEGRRPVPHRRRARVRKDRPLHVTIRLLAGLPMLRRGREFRAVKNALARAHREGFGVVHFSVMSNHLHLIVEARDKRWLARGMQGLKISIAKRLNKIWQRKGTVFSERYHVREIATPTQARNTLVYVLGNARKHAAQRCERLPARWVDPYSSARQFDGWRQNVRPEAGVVVPAGCWLLRAGWRRGGPIDAHAMPTRAPP